MATATSRAIGRRWLVAIATAGLAGAAATGSAIALAHLSGSRAENRSAGAGVLAPGGLARVQPQPAPMAWARATIASGAATVSHPQGWKAIPGDSGTVSFALRGGDGRYLGYLNVTPRQGEERLAGWAAFRVRRNAADEDTNVRALASAEHIRFAGAEGSCVIDDYISRVGSNRYRELACLVSGRHSSSVFVGATLVSDWPTLGAVVVRAASSLVER